MNEAVKQYDREDGSFLEIFVDENPENPRENGGNLGEMITFHGRYSIGDVHNYSSPGSFLTYLLTDPEGYYKLSEKLVDELATRQKVERIAKGPVILLPIYLYDHSIQHVSTASFHGRAHHAEWDSMQIGWIYTTPKMIRECFGCKGINGTIKKRAIASLIAEVKLMDDYMSGSVYYYAETLSDDTVGDCCGGFYGTDVYDNGIYDSVSKEWQEAIDKVEGGKAHRRVSGFEYIG